MAFMPGKAIVYESWEILISGHRDGIYFEFVKHSIWRNISEKNLRYGLHFMFSNNNAYYSNIFKNNGAGVAVMFSKELKMVNNYFEENWGDAAYGLLLKEISDGYIANNSFYKNTAGIFMEGTSRAEMLKNILEIMAGPCRYRQVVSM